VTHASSDFYIKGTKALLLRDGVKYGLPNSPGIRLRETSFEAGHGTNEQREKKDG
jgi:hypothetical protein